MHNRILILNDHFTTYRVPLFRGLYKHIPGLKVIYCSDQNHIYTKHLPHPLGYPYEILSSLRLQSQKPPYDQKRTILFPPALLPAIISFRPEMVVSYAFSIPTWISFLYSRVFRVPFVSWSTDTLHTERKYGFFQKKSRQVIIPRASAYITPSRSGAEKYIAYGADPSLVKVVVQSPDVDFFIERSDQARSSKTYHPARTQMKGEWLLYVGSLSEHKGLRHLLRAFRIVRSSLPSSHLILAGEGPLIEWIKRFVADHGMSESVHLVGFIPQSELPSLYASADLFVFPSLEDTFGVVVAEAASCALPILSSIFAGVTGEYVLNGENGFQVDPRDESLLAKEIIDLFRNPSSLNSMARISREIAIENHPDRSVTNFIEALRIAAAQNRKD